MSNATEDLFYLMKRVGDIGRRYIVLLLKLIFWL